MARLWNLLLATLVRHTMLRVANALGEAATDALYLTQCTHSEPMSETYHPSLFAGDAQQ